jgi:GMP synthase-like glutamine amidotransferase
MRHLTVLQHTHSEWLGLIEDHLEGRGIRFGYVRPFSDGSRLPAASVVGDGLILLGGGAWGASSGPRQLPWLEEEVRLARACLMLDKPVLGIGLGAQILSLAADGWVAQAPLMLRIAEARRCAADALNGYLPAAFPSVALMRDRPVPPPHARILAVDEIGEPALFQIGDCAFGFTGHPGLKRAMIEDLAMEFDDPIDGLEAALSALTPLAPAIEQALVPIMTGIVQLAGWMR